MEYNELKAFKSFMIRFNPLDYQKIINSNNQFIDNVFPPNESSLFNPQNSKNHHNLKMKWNGFEWVTTSQIFGNSKYLFDINKISPDQIKQGILGNCYFLCSLSSLAKYPKRVASIFLTPILNNSGIYVLRVFVFGRYVSICVDDYFPVYKFTLDPVFAHSNDNSLWVMVLEKCWAKVNGSFENTIGGIESESLTFLTGAPSKNIENKSCDHEKLWIKINYASNQDYIITAATREDTRKSMIDKQLLGLHGYSLLNTYEINFGQNRILRLVYLRNPWGTFEWTGDWSHKSSLWTNDIKQRIQYKNEKGAFYMCFEDYLKYFGNTVINMVHDDYFHTYLETNLKSKQYKIYLITIDKSTKGYISLYTHSNRMMSYCSQNQKDPFISLIIAKVDKDNAQVTQYVAGKSHNRDNCTINCMSGLEAGNYILISSIVWNNENSDIVTISLYFSIKAKIIEITSDKTRNLLYETIKICAMTHGKKTILDDQSTLIEYQCFKESKSRFMGVYLINKNPNFDSKIIYTFNEFKNLELENKTNSAEINLGYNQDSLLLVYKNKYSYSFKMQSSFILSPKANNSCNPICFNKHVIKKKDLINYTSDNIKQIGKKIDFYIRYNFLIYSFEDDDSKYLMFENTSREFKFKGIILLDIKNLNSQKGKFKQELRPLELKLKKFEKLKEKEPATISCILESITLTKKAIAQSFNEQKVDPKLIQDVKTAGKHFRLKDQFEHETINAVVLKTKTKDFFYFENTINQTVTSIYSITYPSPEIKDLAITFIWEIELGPKAFIIKSTE